MGCQILTLICEEPQAAGVNQMFPSPEIIISIPNVISGYRQAGGMAITTGIAISV